MSKQAMLLSPPVAFAYDDRAAAVDAAGERQTARAFCKVYLLVSEAAGCQHTGTDSLDSVFRQT